MNSRRKIALEKLVSRSFPILKWVITLVLVLSLCSCVEKAGSQEVSIDNQTKALPVSPISGQFVETTPPDVIQELRPSLEGYQPQVTIISPQGDEVLQDDTVKVSLQVKDLPIFKDPQWQLGPHLHVILDNQPYIAVYDLSQPLILPNLSPGSHTLRVFASRPWHESFKNEGAYAQTTFHIFTKTDDNNPEPNLPVLTYSRPNASYGAEPIMLDFYLTNAPLHIASEDNVEDTMSDWRIRCTINGENFVLDRWQTVYLKGFQPGKTWVKLEFLDNQGNPVKNAFNSTVRLINYQPNGQDTLSRIVRGELTADEVRGIVDQNYTPKTPETQTTPIPKVDKTPELQPEIETQPVPETQTTPIPKVEIIPKPQPEIEKPPVPETQTTAIPKVEITPELQPEIEKPPVPETQTTPIPKVDITPELQPEIEKPPVPETQTTPIPKVDKTPELQPEIEKPPVPETQTTPIPKVEIIPKPQPEITPTPPAIKFAAPELQPKFIPTPSKKQLNPPIAV
ncbi:hypothetical protein [Trichormus variabilis]|uniref:hypothetical protein n=1 Tax=Anabaena variabilis TaxID=264691 RepID=UPI000F8F141E|nr:hypothetical protein [Trichormus variabilis]